MNKFDSVKNMEFIEKGFYNMKLDENMEPSIENYLSEKFYNMKLNDIEDMDLSIEDYLSEKFYDMKI